MKVNKVNNTNNTQDTIMEGTTMNANVNNTNNTMNNTMEETTMTTITLNNSNAQEFARAFEDILQANCLYAESDQPEAYGTLTIGLDDIMVPVCLDTALAVALEDMIQKLTSLTEMPTSDLTDFMEMITEQEAKPAFDFVAWLYFYLQYVKEPQQVTFTTAKRALVIEKPFKVLGEALKAVCQRVIEDSGCTDINAFVAQYTGLLTREEATDNYARVFVQFNIADTIIDNWRIPCGLVLHEGALTDAKLSIEAGLEGFFAASTPEKETDGVIKHYTVTPQTAADAVDKLMDALVAAHPEAFADYGMFAISLHGRDRQNRFKYDTVMMYVGGPQVESLTRAITEHITICGDVYPIAEGIITEAKAYPNVKDYREMTALSKLLSFALTTNITDIDISAANIHLEFSNMTHLNQMILSIVEGIADDNCYTVDYAKKIVKL